MRLLVEGGDSWVLDVQTLELNYLSFRGEASHSLPFDRPRVWLPSQALDLHSLVLYLSDVHLKPDARTPHYSPSMLPERQYIRNEVNVSAVHCLLNQS
jgi:hypothetical protein